MYIYIYIYQINRQIKTYAVHLMYVMVLDVKYTKINEKASGNTSSQMWSRKENT